MISLLKSTDSSSSKTNTLKKLRTCKREWVTTFIKTHPLLQDHFLLASYFSIIVFLKEMSATEVKPTNKKVYNMGSM
jgi:hypothetical protein